MLCVFPLKIAPCQQQPTALPLEFKPNSILGSCFSCGRYIFVASQKRKPARAYSVSVSPFVCENLPIALFYSEEFTNIKKIHFVSVEICSSNSADDSDPRIQTTLYAVTDEGYVLHFKDGQLVYAIPMGDEIKISSDTELHVFRPYGLIKTLVVVRSQDNVFLVDTAERQVIKTWRGVHSCHCDDFVGLGCPQLLILKEEFKTNSGWLLTDTFSVLVDQLGGDGQDKPTVEKHKDSTSAAIHALQTRLTNDLVNLSEKRREVTCRESFISSTWQTLQGNLQGRPLCQASKDPSMVTIMNKREGQPLAGRTPKVVNRCEPATVTEIWQRVVEGHWVIGVDCMAKNIMSFQVVLVPEKGEQSYLGCITCSSNHICDDTNIFRTKQRSIKISEDISSIQNSQKKRRLSVACLEEEEGLYPLIKHFPTCVASLPKFGMAKKVCCRVLLQWTEDDGQPPSGSQDCGVVCLSVEDIIRDKYNLKRETTSETESSRDLLALSLIQLDVGLKLEGTCPSTLGASEDMVGGASRIHLQACLQVLHVGCDLPLPRTNQGGRGSCRG
ncbi:uncharacterized protein LOC117329057 [Pecten maximus]|uniref:uncharacterized protein LOC117329057 n=1 Tax=Pecten maximus TaxID=6579 RepID=UPI001458CA63|nr:uncharacterized protein LOC117329057 [Pecten maximus]